MLCCSCFSIQGHKDKKIRKTVKFKNVLFIIYFFDASKLIWIMNLILLIHLRYTRGLKIVTLTQATSEWRATMAHVCSLHVIRENRLRGSPGLVVCPTANTNPLHCGHSTITCSRRRRSVRVLFGCQTAVRFAAARTEARDRRTDTDAPPHSLRYVPCGRFDAGWSQNPLALPRRQRNSRVPIAKSELSNFIVAI